MVGNGPGETQVTATPLDLTYFAPKMVLTMGYTSSIGHALVGYRFHLGCGEQQTNGTHYCAQSEVVSCLHNLAPCVNY
jgi:hypothetical protein